MSAHANSRVDMKRPMPVCPGKYQEDEHEHERGPTHERRAETPPAEIQVIDDPHRVIALDARRTTGSIDRSSNRDEEDGEDGQHGIGDTPVPSIKSAMP